MFFPLKWIGHAANAIEYLQYISDIRLAEENLSSILCLVIYIWDRSHQK